MHGKKDSWTVALKPKQRLEFFDKNADSAGMDTK